MGPIEGSWRRALVPSSGHKCNVREGGHSREAQSSQCQSKNYSTGMSNYAPQVCFLQSSLPKEETADGRYNNPGGNQVLTPAGTAEFSLPFD